MKEIEYLKEKNELVDIVHCAFNDWDDYNEECYESGISPQEDVEDFVADAVLHAGYRKQSEGEWRETTEPLGAHSVDCVECSACGDSWVLDEDFDFDTVVTFWHYCPTCGAKMKGE